jgi:hypothetical protein
MQLKISMWLQVLTIIAVFNLCETGVKMGWDQNQHEIGGWIKAWMDKHPDYRQSVERKTYDWFGHEIVSDADSHNTVGKPNSQDALPNDSPHRN